MSLGRAAIPSSRMRAPSLIIGYIMLEDLVVGHDAALAPEPGQRLVDQLLDIGIGQRAARAAFIFVVALAGLLAEAAGFAQRIRDLRLDAAVFPRAPADIEAGKVAHRERSHRHAE